VDPSGHRTCTAEQAATGDETCDQNITNQDDPILPLEPHIDLGSGSWELLTPEGDGVITWYDYPVVSDPSISNPADLPNQEYFRMQGSVKLNGVNFSWKGQWVISPGPCNPPYASSTQCIVPFEHRNSSRSVTGAVLIPGNIPQGRERNILIIILGVKGEFSRGLLVNVRDECPACSPSGVDILTLDSRRHTSYNGKSRNQAYVYIWLWIPSPFKANTCSNFGCK
jgi:hypothetical protein